MLILRPLEKLGRSCCIEERSQAAQPSPSAELLRSSSWNLAKLCDLSLNPECLGPWPSHSWPWLVQPVPLSFHSITLPAWALLNLRLEGAPAGGGWNWWLLSQRREPDHPHVTHGASHRASSVPPHPKPGWNPRPLPPQLCSVGRKELGPSFSLSSTAGLLPAGRDWPSLFLPVGSLGPGPPLSACATSSQKENQRDHSGPSELCLTHLLLYPVLVAQGNREPRFCGLRISPIFPSVSGA